MTNHLKGKGHCYPFSNWATRKAIALGNRGLGLWLKTKVMARSFDLKGKGFDVSAGKLSF